MLSDVMSDTTLKTAGIELQAAQKSKEEAAQNAINNQTTGVIIVPTLNDSLLTAQQQKADSGKQATSSIMKISERTTTAGTSMVFVDVNTHDTVNVFLPKQQEVNKTDTSVAVNTIPDSTTAAKNIVDTTTIVIPQGTTVNQQAEIKNENPLPDTSVLKTNPNNPFYKENKVAESAVIVAAADNNKDGNQNTENQPVVSSSAFKQDCNKMLAAGDLDKLKKKMVSTSTDDKMIQTAKKYIEDKCITTDQVKSLGALFITDDARYSFFDALYKNVYDVSAFPSLESQLIDPYYKKRFRAMLK